MKPCYRCKVMKPQGEFFKDASKSSGYRCICKACDAARQKGLKLRPEQVAQRTIARRLRGFDAKKGRAGTQLREAVKKGIVQKWPVCAMPECHEQRVEAHHADYDNPLGVTWLCARHHRLAHYSIRSEA